MPDDDDVVAVGDGEPHADGRKEHATLDAGNRNKRDYEQRGHVSAQEALLGCTAVESVTVGYRSEEYNKPTSSPALDLDKYAQSAIDAHVSGLGAH